MAFRDSNDGPTPPCGPRPAGARSSRSQRQRSPLPEAHALSVTLPVPARPGSAAATADTLHAGKIPTREGQEGLT